MIAQELFGQPIAALLPEVAVEHVLVVHLDPVRLERVHVAHHSIQPRLGGQRPGDEGDLLVSLPNQRIHRHVCAVLIVLEHAVQANALDVPIQQNDGQAAGV